MPGNTENQDILTGINQVIQAINSLNVPTEANGIVEKLERIRTAIVEDTAVRSANQSNDFYELISAIQELTLSCQTIVNTTQLYQTISCGGSGTAGAGTFPADPTPQTDTSEDQTGDPPTGFGSWSEYHQYKCDVAYFILNQMMSDIATTGLLAAGESVAGSLALLLIAALFTPIGWAEIIALSGLVISLLATGVSIYDVVAVLEENLDDFACSLFSGTSVADSISNFADLVDSKVVESEEIGIFGDVGFYLASNYLKSWATIDSFNRLYKKVPYSIPGGNDCSGCDETATYTIDLGEETSEHPANPIQVNYAEAGYGCPGNHHMQVTFSQPVTVTNIVQVNTFGVCAGYSLFYYWDNPDTGTTPILSTNGRPQDTGEVSGVRVLQSTTTADPSPQAYIIVTYTPE